MFRNAQLFCCLLIGTCSVYLLLPVCPLQGQQQPSPQSEAPLIGEINIEGESFRMNFEGATINLVFNNSNPTGSTPADKNTQVERLLFLGLESLELSANDKPHLEMFAEAYRLAPRNPQVAFWYAKVLAESGDGKMAQEVFYPHRKEIASAYPRQSNQLAQLIAERLELEELPSKLVSKIDEFHDTVRLSKRTDGESDSYAAYFRLIDQDDLPINASAFRIQCNGEKEKTESFDEGYHLFTFQRRRSYDNSPCKIEISDVELAKESFEFHGARNGVEDLGSFQVRRYRNSDRKKVDVVVKNAAGDSLKGVGLQFKPQANNRNSSSLETLKSNQQGRVSTMLFPGEYYCTASLQGYLSANLRIKVPEDGKLKSPQQMELYSQIPASAELRWRAKRLEHARADWATAEATTGEMQLTTGSPYNYSFPIALRQEKDKVQLIINYQHYGHPFGMQSTNWLGIFKPETEDSSAAFRAIDLEKLQQSGSRIDTVKPKSSTTSNRRITVDVKQGSIYVGEFIGRDPRGGQPAMTSFKLIVEKIGRSP